MTLRERLEELRAWYGTVSGRLAAIASGLAGLLMYVSQDPSAALFVSMILPPPLNYLLIGGVIVVAYILPHWASKKDGCDNGE